MKVPSVMSTPDTSIDFHGGAITPLPATSDWSLIAKLALTSISSQGTMGVLVLTGLVSTINRIAIV